METVNKPLTHRQRQALATQQLILNTARSLFFELGYGLTTIEAISQKAGVAVSTVYGIYKSKRGILKAIREAWHQESGQRDIYVQALEEADPHRRLALFAHATRRQWETGASMMAIYASAASSDPEAFAELQAAIAGRRAGITAHIAATMPLLRSDLPLERVAAIYLSLTRSELYQELVEVWGWTPQEYEQWLGETLQCQLLP